VSADRFMLALGQFSRALDRLDEALAEPETSLMRDALIQRFEFSYELARKCMFHWLLSQGESVNDTGRAVIQAAYRAGLIADAQTWELIKDCRNETSHTYDEARAIAVAAFIRATAGSAFRLLHAKLTELGNDVEG
jgi:nucleotidyltransferase substrate binding protein (TIGR01987 family)